MYERGQGVDRDIRRALYWYRSAADLGFPGGQYAVGLAYRDGLGVRQDDAEAVKWLRLAAEQGHRRAQYNLGVMLDRGRGIRRNVPEAIRWYQAAAAQGDAAAMNNIGYKYQKGAKGVRRNGREAVGWYLQAIEHGELGHAAHNLARIYEDAIDVPRDRVSAYIWRRLAHRDSRRDAEECVKDLVKKMSPADIEEANRRAEQWPPWRVALCATMFPGEANPTTASPFAPPSCSENAPSFTVEGIAELERDAGDGDPTAQCWLGHAFAFGRGVRQSHEEAASWFQEAARQGHAAAQYALGNFFEYGRGVEGDIDQAVSWYRKAAEQGLPAAQAKVGFIYSGQRRFKEAVEWIRKAAEQGDLMAQINLASMYADGQGVPRDHTSAYAWILIARNQACSLDTEAWEKHDVDPQRLPKLRNREAAKLSPEQKNEAERRAEEYRNR
jgi:TPR repeat protein